MPDIVFLIASVPALVTLGYFALGERPSDPESEPEDGSRTSPLQRPSSNCSGPVETDPCRYQIRSSSWEFPGIRLSGLRSERWTAAGGSRFVRSPATLALRRT